MTLLNLTPTTPGSLPFAPDYPIASLGIYNVKDYLALGDGATDDTSAIDTAWAAASAANGVLFFPEGNYLYNGVGLTGTQIRVVGEGVAATSVTLGATSRFINVAVALSALRVSGFTFSGGIDVIRSTFTGSNVTDMFVVEDCYFLDYTKAAISTNASDMPYWKVARCIFQGANDTATIGIALSGLVDAAAITDCDFRKNRIHIKLRRGGNNAYIDRCDFIRFGATGGSPRVDVWCVPHTTVVNCGQGLTVTAANKFGNENRDSADYFVLYADEDTSSGTDNSTYFPKLSADSTGYIAGHRVGGSFYGIGTALPVVYSTTPNVLGSRYDLMLSGDFTYLLQFRTAPTADRNNCDNVFHVFGPIPLATETTAVPAVSNGNGVGYLIDPAGVLDTRTTNPMSQRGASDPTDYVKLLPTGIRSFSVGSVTLSNTTDVFGGVDASELNFTAAGGIAWGQLTMGSVVVGQPLWVEFDVKVGAATALTLLRVDLETEGGAFHMRRVIPIPSVWRRVRILHTPRTATGQTDVVFSTNTVETGKVKLGRVRVYQAREPQNDGAYPIAAGANKILSGSGVPDSGLGGNGDFYFRIDTPGSANQRLYVKAAGAWTGIL